MMVLLRVLLLSTDDRRGGQSAAAANRTRTVRSTGEILLLIVVVARVLSDLEDFQLDRIGGGVRDRHARVVSITGTITITAAAAAGGAAAAVPWTDGNRLPSYHRGVLNERVACGVTLRSSDTRLADTLDFSLRLITVTVRAYRPAF